MSRRRCGVYRCLEPWLPLLLSRGCPYISQRDAPFVSFFVMMEGQEVTQEQSSGCFQGGRSQLVSTVSSAAFPFSCPESPSHSRSLFFFLTNILTVELTEKVVSAAGSCSRLLAAGRRGSPHYVACLSQLPPGEKRSLSSGTPRKLPDHAVDTVVSFAAFPQRTPGSVQVVRVGSCDLKWC